MNNQRLISDARREAKRLARISGRPHQHHLDEIAVRAGLKDWEAFFANPVVAPVPAETSHAPQKGEIRLSDTDAMQSDATSGDDVAPARTERKSRFRNPAFIAGMVLVAGIAAVVLLLNLNNRLRGDLDESSRAIVAMHDDRERSTTLRFSQSPRDMPITSLRRTDKGLEMSIMAADDRFAPVAYRRQTPHELSDASGGRAMAVSMTEHPVVRLAGRVDCTIGAFVPLRYETADDYRGSTQYAFPLNPHRRAWRMSASDAARICSTPGTGDITDAISRT